MCWLLFLVLPFFETQTMDKHYQVLARKYRPHSFAEMVGQTHTVKTLINALDANNLHHGFLFTGTRGVGKTTIARIFAKSINCEKGISSKPCGKCLTCIEIDKGQSIDLIEIDAASYTGVENMRNILENAQYMPTKNRYKIYLIDEVHMLSSSSFNALLKTLEEPPEHIKFLLATTDPKKLPITVLSRCLQFKLQKLTQAEIFSQLKFVMHSEKLEYEELALRQIADFGNGSMRDSLSLLDQSIAYGNGTVMSKDIKSMLSLVGHDDMLTLTTHLFNQDAEAVINFIKKLSHKGENLSHALQDLTVLLHQISVAQIIDNDQVENGAKALATQISSQDLQLFYHIAINGIKEMSLAPSEQIGFEMTLLRMLAFRNDIANFSEKKTAKLVSQPNQPKKVEKTKKRTSQAKLNIGSQTQWEEIIKSLDFSPAARTLLKNTVFGSYDNQILTLILDKQLSNLLTNDIQTSIQTTLNKYFVSLTLKIQLDKLTKKRLTQKEAQANQQKTAAMQSAFLKDEGVQKLQKTFDTKVNTNSIREVENV